MASCSFLGLSRGIPKSILLPFLQLSFRSVGKLTLQPTCTEFDDFVIIKQ